LASFVPDPYRAKRVVVAGGGGTGIGAATGRLAAELGAEVVVFDLQPPADGGLRFALRPG
jgi:NAD(P)-dependent dehydrogenase (short-subunit alcohol dehydrogenase family)